MNPQQRRRARRPARSSFAMGRWPHFSLRWLPFSLRWLQCSRLVEVSMQLPALTMSG